MGILTLKMCLRSALRRGCSIARNDQQGALASQNDLQPMAHQTEFE